MLNCMLIENTGGTAVSFPALFMELKKCACSEICKEPFNIDIRSCVTSNTYPSSWLTPNRYFCGVLYVLMKYSFENAE